MLTKAFHLTPYALFACSVQANTEYRESSKEDEMYELLIEIKANQEFLIKRYDAEVNR